MGVADGAGFVEIAGQHLEYRQIPAARGATSNASCIVMLHEGLGCVGLWGDFPDRLASATGARVFVYARAGYGHSSPVPLPRPLSYMHDEARDVLPKLLDTIDFQHGILLGHSDGASIAAIYAGLFDDPRVKGISLIAPHFIVEDISISAIEDARVAYQTTDLGTKLARWHGHVDVAFRGWNDAWLDPAFRHWDLTPLLPKIKVPMQIIQGALDQYGTVRQIECAQQHGRRQPRVTLLPDIRHTPHREAPDATLAALTNFLQDVERA